MSTTKKRRFRIFSQSADIEAAILGELGLSSAAIEQRTGLKPHCINYRLSKAGIKRSDFRNGESRIADQVIRTFSPALTRTFNETVVPRFQVGQPVKTKKTKPSS
jgi:hypothetical protein